MHITVTTTTTTTTTTTGCKSAVLLLYNSRGDDAGSFTPILSTTTTKATVAPLTSGQVHEIPTLTSGFKGEYSVV